MRTLVVNALRMSEARTGQGRHIEYVAQQWSRMSIPFDRVILMSPGELKLNNLGKATPIHFEIFGSRIPRIGWEQTLLPFKARGAAMLFCPSYTCPLSFGGPMVMANHGIYEALPQEFSSFTRWRATVVQRLSAQYAQRVIANSSNTLNDIHRFFCIPKKKMDIIYPAAHDCFFKNHSSDSINKEIVNVFGRPVPYVIFVGKLAKRRNIPNLIEAFAKVKKTNKLPHHLLIAGPNTTDVPVNDLATSHGVEEAVNYLPYLELEPLARLYAGADVFALPTTYEGISQTMFEAMASGTAVLTVDHPTLVEGGNEGVLSVPSPSVPDLVEGLSRLLLNASVRKSFGEKGRQLAKRFTWETVAKETMKILDREGNARDGEDRRYVGSIQSVNPQGPVA